MPACHNVADIIKKQNDLRNKHDLTRVLNLLAKMCKQESTAQGGGVKRFASNLRIVRSAYSSRMVLRETR